MPKPATAIFKNKKVKVKELFIKYNTNPNVKYYIFSHRIYSNRHRNLSEEEVIYHANKEPKIVPKIKDKKHIGKSRQEEALHTKMGITFWADLSIIPITSGYKLLKQRNNNV